MNEGALQLSDACFEKYVKVVHKITGITLEKNRKKMLVGRLRRRIGELKLTSYDEYLQYLAKNKSEEEHFINCVTTNETYFYRTPRVWDFFVDEFLANWNTNKKLNVWSAASSTGEEAHTLGVLCQNFKSSNAGFKYSVLGTDISSDVVARCSQGNYIGRAVERFRNAKPELFEKYMIGSDADGYSVTRQIKGNINFKTHNLFNPLKGENTFDLIFLRNVLIYFTRRDQEKVLAQMQKCLSPEGYLIIGESESIASLNTNFVLQAPLIYRLKTAIRENAA